MKLRQWVDIECRRRDESRRIVLQRLSAYTEISYITLTGADRGARIDSYRRGKAIEQATGGEVSIQEVCDPEGDA